MTYRHLTIIGAALALTACGQVSPDYADTLGARKAASQRLIDPGSAKFQNLYIVERAPDRHTVCGQINGKNRSGAYVGFRSFSWTVPEGALRFDLARPATIASQLEWCGH